MSTVAPAVRRGEEGSEVRNTIELILGPLELHAPCQQDEELAAGCCIYSDLEDLLRDEGY